MEKKKLNFLFYIEKFFMYSFERHTEPLLPFKHFLPRAIKHFFLGLSVIIISLLCGIFGYHYIEGMSWIDSLLNASMILGGMGPIGELKTFGGKLFASIYALFSGIVFLITVGIIIAPAVHRFLHQFHLEKKV